MSWLSSFGSALKKVFTQEAKYEPVVAATLAAIPQTQAVAAGLNVFQGIVGGVEAIYDQSGTGAQKLSAAAPMVESAILTSGFLSGKKVADVTKYQKSISDMTSAFADLLNSLEPATPTAPAA